MTETKIPFEEAAKMSLDECVSKMGITDLSRKYNRRYKNHRSYNGGNEEHTSDHQSNGFDYDPSIPSASSQQWRLKNPNRLAGMAPLIPSNAKTRKFNFNSNRFRQNRRNSYQDRDAPNRDAASRDAPNRDGINRNNQPSFKPQMNRNNNMLKALTQNNATQQNLPMISNPFSSDLVSLNPPSNTVATLNSLATIGSQMISNPAGYMDMARMLIEKLDEARQSRINQPKYDMSLQKEISEIQGRTLFFTCGSGGPQSVVSFDGPGVDDCNVKVAATDISMNQRFA